MAKLQTNPIEPKDLEEYISTSDDFRLELEVLNSCSKLGFPTQHGGTYQDPVTKKDRQFDLRTQITKGLCVLKLAVECKNLKTNFPLLVSRVPRTENESYHEIVISTRPSDDPAFASLALTNSEAHRFSSADGIFPFKGPVGKSTVQVGRNSAGEIVSGDSEVYEKWSQALASAFDLVSDSNTDYKEFEEGIAATVVLPILVVADASLWVADYSLTGEPEGSPKPCEECQLFIGKDVFTGLPGVEYNFSHLMIFTKTKFEGYLSRLTSNDKYWDLLFPPVKLNRLLRPILDSMKA